MEVRTVEIETHTVGADDSGRPIPVMGDPMIGIQMLDTHGLELIIHDEAQAEYPAAPVGLFPGSVPVIGRSG
jgi:hypothetical protein